jgi:hypothetical protein
MKQNNLQEELDKKRLFIVKYALHITICVIMLVILLLCMLKIEGQSIFEMTLNYYLKK